MSKKLLIILFALISYNLMADKICRRCPTTKTAKEYGVDTTFGIQISVDSSAGGVGLWLNNGKDSLKIEINSQEINLIGNRPINISPFDTTLWKLGTGTNSLMSKNNFSGLADTTYSLLINSTNSTSSGFQSAIINSSSTVVNSPRGVAIGSTSCNLDITQSGKANNFVLATSNSQIRRELTGSIGGFKDSLDCVHCVSIGTYRAKLPGYHLVAIGNLPPLVTDSPSTWLSTGWLFLAGNGTIVNIDSPHLDTRSSAFAIRKNGQTLINYTDPETAADADTLVKLYVNGGATISSTTSVFNIAPMTATQASAITPKEGDFVNVSNTNGTFTSIGLWQYIGAAWVKL